MQQMPQNYLRLIDINTPGPRYDVTPLFADPVAFGALVDDITEAIPSSAYDFVAGIDALGFILGTAVAIRAGKGFIPIRKGGKLPVATKSVSFVDYSKSEKSLELRADLDLKTARILLVDEWIETGAQVNAAISLIKSQGGEIAGIATINMDENEATQLLKEKYHCYQAWRE